jgi:hypothetical protein
MNRLDVLCAVAPLLTGDAAVVLVADEPGWDTAIRRAFQALAEAAVVEEAGPGRRVAVVEGGTGAQIACLARREWNEARAVSLADLSPDLSYVDWRNEVMNLTSSAETTYFGWQRSDGSRRTAVLRRSVLSPVPGGDDGGHSLGRAVLTDALGAHTFDELQHWDTSLAEAFFEEVIRPLPPEAFELPIHSVATWVVRRSLSDQPVLGLGTVAAVAASGEDRSGG